MDHVPTLNRAKMLIHCTKLQYQNTGHLLVSSGDYSEAPYLWQCTKSECQNLPGYPKVSIWQCPPCPPPPKKKSGHFQSGLQICKVTLYPRGDLKVYHLLPSYFLWNLLHLVPTEYTSSSSMVATSISWSQWRVQHRKNRPLYHHKQRLIWRWQNRSRSTLADAIIVAVYQK